MSAIEKMQGGIAINPELMLSGKSLMEEASRLPEERFEAGPGLTVIRQGNFFKMEGGDNLSAGAHIAAYEASKMGGDAGRAMFQTYRQHNPSEFDGSRNFEAMLNRSQWTMPEPPPREAPGALQNNDPKQSAESSATGTGAPATSNNPATSPGEAFRNSEGNDALTDYSLWMQHMRSLTGTSDDDVMIAGNGNEMQGGDGDDDIRAGNGDDALTAGRGNTLYGGAGDDVVDTYGDNTVYGGGGNDRISTYGNSRVSAGEGDDYVSGYTDMMVDASTGDNFVHAYDRAVVSAGSGDDWITTYSNSKINAGDGDNYITTYADSSITSGRGADYIRAGHHSEVVSGDGDDLVEVGRDSTVYAGTGDDRVTIKGDSTYHFMRGDGNDILGGGQWGRAYSETENLSSSVIVFGPGISAAELGFQGQGNDLLVDLGKGDSITLKDYQRHGIASMIFDDGSNLSSEEITNALGPLPDYEPISPLTQKWHDAGVANRRASNSGEETAV
ncbi:MAG: hypothetical protein HOC63_12180 [Rhodospirillales bacterium]|nr:hypothetical protein [Rhodospirillales bacterium]MBT4038746.1 hypothetical protein [Rhodospirillales bacterium]MBT4627435.1 hypothetical protein [Rhodospirillales bacterium]MBT5353372.1 hypothetical protein [Rhodospirillales bacterium]MBT5522402.1 hypothetical protein [Rhodospirillales bacterium]